ncbi:MAG: hypothetical protein ACREXT_08345, partial [Gammaproteobacteria bacterium]
MIDFDAPFTARWSIPTDGSVTSSGSAPPPEACVRSTADPACTLMTGDGPLEMTGDVASPAWSAGTCQALLARELRCTAQRTVMDSTGQEYRREYALTLVDWRYQLKPPTATRPRTQSFRLSAALLPDTRASITLSDCKFDPSGVCSTVGTVALTLSAGETVSNYELLNVPFDLEIDGDGILDIAPRRSPGELPRWFTANGWEQSIYAAYAAAHGPAEAVSNCAAHALGCLTVRWTREVPSAPVTIDNVPGVVLLAGVVLSGSLVQSRPSALLADYFEADNAIEDAVFTKRALAPDFNDSLLML